MNRVLAGVGIVALCLTVAGCSTPHYDWEDDYSSTPSAGGYEGDYEVDPILWLPDYRGRNLVDAEKDVKRQGFEGVKTADFGGRHRTVVHPENWKVCDQDPLPGRMNKSATVTLKVLEVVETCDPTGGLGF
jgi:hypothetical protein